MSSSSEDIARPAAAVDERFAIDSSVAICLGWALVACAQAGVIAIAGPRARTVGVRVLHHVYDVGQLAACALVAFALAGAFRRWGFRDARRSYGVFALGSMVAGVLLMHDDFAGFTAKLFGPSAAWSWITGAVFGLAIPSASLVGAILAKPFVRWAGVAVGLAAAVTNDFVLQSGYSGIHLVATTSAATLIAASLVGTSVPVRLTLPKPLRRGLAVFVAALATWTVVVPPGSDVLLALFRLPGSSLAPYVAEVHAFARRRFSHSKAAAANGQIDPAWLAPRDGVEPIAPTLPPVLRGAPIVVLVTVDAVRADIVEKDDLLKDLPGLRRLKAGSAWFSEARSTAPATTPSIGALMSGKYYSQLYWAETPFEERDGEERSKVFPDKDPSVRFPEILTAAGVDTVTFVATQGLRSEFGVVKGFAEEQVVKGGKGRDMIDGVIDRVKRQGDKPLFVYAHVMDVHAPYPKGPGGAFARYLRAVGTADKQLDRLVRFARSDEHASRVALIVSADHGEGFNEHGAYFHAVSVYDELLRIPLLVQARGITPRRVPQRVSLIDLGPTILDLFGQPTPGHFMGQSLVPMLTGDERPLRRPIAADSGRRMQALVFEDGRKVIRDLRRGTIELYDLNVDPGETTNLAGGQPDAADRAATVLDAFFGSREFKRPGYETPYRP